MNQRDLQTRVYQIGEHERRLPDSRQKSSLYRSAVMMVVKIYLGQLVKEKSTVHYSCTYFLRFGTGIVNENTYLARCSVQHLQLFWRMALY